MPDNPRRIARERKTLQTMMRMYCRYHHPTHQPLCPECAELMQYALHRLDKCPFQPDKPTCAKCPIHCYQPAMRARIAAIMRYSGPRLLLRHPLLALLHLLDARRKIQGR